MPIGATIGAVGSLASAGIGAYSSSRASDAQANAAAQSLAFQQQVYQQNQTNLRPYMQTGQGAMYSLANLYGIPTPGNPGGAQSTNAAFDAFTKLPAYQFPFQQGNLALERQLNAQGRQQSGAQVRATQQFGQGLASQYMMGNYVNPLMQMAQTGGNAAAGLGNMNNTSAGQIGQSYGNMGAAQASGYMGMGNAMAGGVNNLAVYSALGRGGGGSGTYELSGPQWGGGNFMSGDAWGGNSGSPLPGLNPSDYGQGY